MANKDSEEEINKEQEEALGEHESFEEIKKVGVRAQENTEESMDESPKFYKSEKETNYYQPTGKRKGKKTALLLFILALIFLVGGGIVFRHKVNSFLKGVQQKVSPTPTPTPTPVSVPTPTPNPLNRSDWGFEVLNGTSTSGLAKKLADKLKELGYPVYKSGNADKQTYETTQFFVKKELQDKVNPVIVDLKDIIKIASISGELKDSTASARIIIGKDLSL